MAKTSFKVSSGEIAAEAEVVPQAAEETKALAVKQETSLAVSNEGDDFGGYDGGADDLVTPRLNLANKTGDLGNNFPPGVFVFNKLVGLSKDGKTPINITVIKAVKSFQEILPYSTDGESALPKRASSPEEVEAQGGTLIWEQRESKQLWGPIAELLVLVEQPEGDLPEEADGQFYVTIEGKNYAPCKWTVAKTAYKAVYPHLKTATKTWAAKDGLLSAKWKLTSELIKKTNMSWYSPVIKGAGLHTPEVLATLRELRASLCPKAK